MKTFKNKNFTERDYECTNVVVMQAERSLDENWIEVPESIIEQMKLQKLWREGNKHFYGWL